MEYKVLIKLYVPTIEEQYDIWIPIGKRINEIVILLSKAINEMTMGGYQPETMPILYNKITGGYYNITQRVMDTDIINGTELIMI